MTEETFRERVTMLPEAVTAALKGVAMQTAVRMRDRAVETLQRLKHPTGASAGQIKIHDDPANHAVLVESLPAPEHPRNLPLWLEYGFTDHGGTFRPGLHYMHDAATAEEARYRADCEAASVNAVSSALAD